MQLIVMVGHPYCGKSTYVEKFLADKNLDEWILISTDKWIEKEAIRRGKDYQTVFGTYADTATKLMWEEAEKAFSDKKNVIWDQTNLTMKTRARKLAIVPKAYRKTAVYFPPLEVDELEKRMKNRTKFVSRGVIDAMIKQLEPPSILEGFDIIINI